MCFLQITVINSMISFFTKIMQKRNKEKMITYILKSLSIKKCFYNQK